MKSRLPSLRALATCSLAGVLAMLLAGCGFQLQGQRELPQELRSVFLDTVVPYRVADSAVEVALRSRLRRRGAIVAGSEAAADSILQLTNLNERRNVLSIGPDGKAIEFELVTEVTYSLRRAGIFIVPPGVVQVRRDLSFNSEQILAKEAEERRLQEFMQDELAELILLRLEASLGGRVLRPTTLPGAALTP
jgi:LPS-assembly lipoprotein